jgi:lipopolysaccharide transport protein LptA
VVAAVRVVGRQALRHSLSTALAGALLVTLASGPAVARSSAAGENAGDVISMVARIVRSFRLTKVSSSMEVLADHMEFDYQKGSLSYEGNVRVTHGGVKLKSDLLTITFKPGADKPLDTIRASGNVQVDYGQETASGDVALYDPQRGTVTLSGGAHLGSGKSSIEGESVVVYLDEGKAIIEGGSKGPVRALIDPDSLDVDKVLE